MITKELIGKTITFADVDGSIVHLKFDDGSEFYYEATDGGYSCWEITKETDCDYERSINTK